MRIGRCGWRKASRYGARPLAIKGVSPTPYPEPYSPHLGKLQGGCTAGAINVSVRPTVLGRNFHPLSMVQYYYKEIGAIAQQLRQYVNHAVPAQTMQDTASSGIPSVSEVAAFQWGLTNERAIKNDFYRTSSKRNGPTDSSTSSRAGTGHKHLAPGGLSSAGCHSRLGEEAAIVRDHVRVP